MNTSNHFILVDLIRETFAQQVLDHHGALMPQAYLLDDWTTSEGYLVNAITVDGLDYELEESVESVYSWASLSNTTLKEVLDRLQQEAFI